MEDKVDAGVSALRLDSINTRDSPIGSLSLHRAHRPRASISLPGAPRTSFFRVPPTQSLPADAWAIRSPPSPKAVLAHCVPGLGPFPRLSRFTASAPLIAQQHSESAAERPIPTANTHISRHLLHHSSSRRLPSHTSARPKAAALIYHPYIQAEAASTLSLYAIRLAVANSVSFRVSFSFEARRLFWGSKHEERGEEGGEPRKRVEGKQVCVWHDGRKASMGDRKSVV